jgi:transposase-like protein
MRVDEFCIVISEVITVRNKYKKFTPADKEAHVKEYIRLSNTVGISQKRYAENHEIAITTFKTWVAQYKEFISTNPSASEESERSGSFIMISADNNTASVPAVYEAVTEEHGLRLRYKEAVLEFQKDQLREVMEILRLW